MHLEDTQKELNYENNNNFSNSTADLLPCDF